MSSTLSPPFEQLSPTNRGPILSVFTFICLTTTFIIVLVKLFSALYFKQRRSTVNIPIWIALAVALVQSILMQMAVDRGLGRHKGSLSAAHLDQYHKLVYSGEILLVTVLGLSKLSTALLILELSPKNNIRKTCCVTIGVIGAWTGFAILGDALQCGVPNPWACPGKRSIQYIIGIVNILTDVVLAGIPVILLRHVQMPLEKRLRIEAAFAVRLLVPVATIAQIVFMPSYLNSKDYTWSIVNSAVCKQFMMSVSIIAACMPTLYHVLSGFSAGFADLHIPENLELSTQDRSKQTQIKSQSKAGAGCNKVDDEFARRMYRQSPFAPGDEYSHHTQVRASSDDAESTESTRNLTRSESQGVVKTVDFWVNVESR